MFGGTVMTRRVSCLFVVAALGIVASPGRADEGAGFETVNAELLGRNAALKAPPKLPASAFAAMPDFRNIALSPSGHRFAARVVRDGLEYIGIFRLDGAEKPWLIQVPKRMDFQRLFWAGNDRLMVSLGQTIPWDTDEALTTRMVLADLVTRTTTVIGKNFKEMGLRGDDVLWIDPEGKTALIALQRTIYEYPGVYRFDLATNRGTQVVAPMTDIWDWYADKAGVVRYGYGWVDSHHWQMVYRKDPSEKFRVVTRGTDKDDDAASVARDKSIAIAAGSNTGFAYGRDEATGRTAIFRYDFAAHKLGERVFAAPDNDVSYAETDESGQTLRVAYYTDSRDRVKWFEPLLAELQTQFENAVRGSLGEREVWISSRNRDSSIMLVQILGSNDPGQYYIWQEANGKLAPLTERVAGLKPADLAITHYVSYPARDGKTIPAYLTLPPGRAAKGLPLIIMPHGGPYDLRDVGDYDSDVQFLVNRGYAVLQPQFRGSGSYGQAFSESGDAQWGRAMQDDIDDGMDWLTKPGLADPARTCIVGSSYGGYAALWGATRNPERYRCAVSFAGISDMARNLKYQLNSFGNRQAREKWRKRVQGDPTFDLASISPLQQIDRLKIPVMLVHGSDDQTVPPKQSRIYAEALKAAGKPHEYYEIPDEGHGFSSPANAQLWYDRLDAFLQKHNPAE